MSVLEQNTVVSPWHVFHLQFQLDSVQFGKEIQQLGLDPAQIEGYNKLSEVTSIDREQSE